jgi:peptidoglycan hydrolase CwlO-like protein
MPAESNVPPVPPSAEISTSTKKNLPLTRAERAKKRRVWSTVAFWAGIFPATIVGLFMAALHFGRDTRVEGQIIPPAGMMLNNEVWIVTDFRSLATGIAEDLAAERTPLMQEIQERQDHVQRAQADVAAREERIRMISDEIQSSKDEIEAVVKESRDATQKIWDVDGAQIDAEYASRIAELRKTIEDRARSLNLKYQPDPTYESPEVWANAYRLALYEVPPGVDTVKEHTWLGDEMKQWRDYEKTLDDRKEQLREKAAQIKLAPAPKIADLNAKIEDLQQRSDATEAEEVPLKAELQQAEADLVQAQAADAGLDDKYYKQLDQLPAEAVTKHIPLASNGRFTWIEDDVFVEGEKEHHYWLFARATRADGRQYWALQHFGISKNQTLELTIEPSGFVSTKAILRPNLSPDEQEQ